MNTDYLDILSTLPTVPYLPIVVVILAAVVAVVVGEQLAADKCQRAIAAVDRREVIERRLTIDRRASVAARSYGRHGHKLSPDARRRTLAQLTAGHYASALSMLAAGVRQSPPAADSGPWARTLLAIECGAMRRRQPSGLVTGL